MSGCQLVVWWWNRQNDKKCLFAAEMFNYLELKFPLLFTCPHISWTLLAITRMMQPKLLAYSHGQKVWNTNSSNFITIAVSRFLSMTVLSPSYMTSISLLCFQFRLDRYIPKIHTIGHFILIICNQLNISA